jgi:hypothetical protein
MKDRNLALAASELRELGVPVCHDRFRISLLAHRYWLVPMKQ